MGYLALKFALSAIIVVAVSEIAKRTTLVGALIAALPLTSILALCWLYAETHDTAKISQLSLSIFWLVLPSLPMFVALPWLLKRGLAFPAAMALAGLLTALCYGGLLLALRGAGIRA
jgi:hypothetical protein